MRVLKAIASSVLLILAAATAQFAREASDPGSAVGTNFAIFVGFPTAEQTGDRGSTLVPGTVIPLAAEAGAGGDSVKRQIIEKSLSFAQAADKLWDTFRLDPARRRQMGKYELAAPGIALELPSVEDAGVRLAATLLHFTDQTATYRIQFRQGDRLLADSTVTVARGGRAVVGGMNGPAAPYVFVFVEPDPPGKGRSDPIPSSKAPGVTLPEITKKVAPKYPEDAKKDKIQGIVILELIIEIDGSVSSIRALQDPDWRLTAAAVEAVRQWQFEPARGKDGKPLRVLSSVTFNFNLR